jgi:hypothetical protein
MSNKLSLYEKNQRVRTLAAIIWIVLIASVALGLLNIKFRTWDSVIALFGLALICIPLLWLNARVKGRCDSSLSTHFLRGR